MLLEKQLTDHEVVIERWFRDEWAKTPALIFGSVDLRNAGFKLAPVDTNLFPAGFNNLNRDMMSFYAQVAQSTITEICPDISRILIIPESHTRNIHYFESLATLQEIFRSIGLEVRIGFIDDAMTKPQSSVLPSGRQIILEPLIRINDKVGVKGFFPCCILLNNDFSAGIPDQLQNISQKMMPPVELGWSTRLKSEHFRFYAKVADSFASKLGLDPWLIMPYFDQCPEVNFMKQEGRDCLVRRCQALLKKIKKKYDQYNIKKEAFLVVKADQGTYGMAVMMIRDPQELMSLNRKQRTRMSTIKGGAAVTRAIIQEGVFSFETAGDHQSVAEPVVYMMGRYVLGGFYRVHKNRGPDENLNAPGMNFEPLSFSQSCFNLKNAASGDRLFYTYGVIARLAMLAAARELAAFKKEL